MKNWKKALMIVLLIVSFFLDKPAIDFCSKIKTPWLDTLMGWFSHEITIFVVLLIISAIFLYQDSRKRYLPLPFISFILAFALSMILKTVIMRNRPTGMKFLTISINKIVTLIIPDYSFPSSHAAMSFSVLPVLDKEFHKVKLFWVGFSILIAVSRIYLNQHYLSDVVAGSILGYLIGYFILRVEEKYGLSKRIIEKF